ncbi:MAG TPA: biotin transporter BioY [Thermoanaerobaculia bacterium]|jgi:biotin transport system substrate-specific component|nr:biotin transporter BioY [Thermoanaerobaculia bacterium]
MNTIPQVLNERVIRGSAVTNVMLVIAASAIIAIAAQLAINVPFSPVPLTMQPVAVLLVGVVLGSKRGAAAAMLYLLEGASGAPVFAQMHGGAIWLTGFTAGYLWSYPFAAFVAGWFSERNWGSTIVRAVAGMLIALAVIYAGGWAWLALLTNARNAFVAGVAPFVIADVVKIAIAAALLPSAQRLVAH